MLLLLALSVQAQISAEVKDILKKCNESSHQSGHQGSGTLIDTNIHISALIASMNGTMKTYRKGDKSLTIVKMKGMGQEAYTEKGFDGKTGWEYQKTSEEGERDTLVIMNNAKPKKDKFDLGTGIESDYKKASLKQTAKFYEIIFTNPKDKDMPKKTIMRIVKDTYRLHQIEAKISIATAKITVTKITIGVNDNIFVFNPNKYPNAVVVRR